MISSAQLGLTTRGSALITAGGTALICGVALGQRDLVRVALLLILVPVVAAYVVSRSRVSIACARSAEPERVSPGTPVLLRLALTNQSLLPTGSLMLEDQLRAPFQQRARFTLDSLRGRESRSLAYRLPLVGRGKYRVGPLQMRLADPFGLVERTRSFRSVNDIVVLPTVEALPDTSLPGAWDSAQQAGSHSVGTHGSDDASIRQYRYGDDLRKVHWRSTARLGSMMVRQEERPWHGRSTLLLDTRGTAHRHATPGSRFGDEPAEKPDAAPDERRRDSFEWAVCAAASIAVHLHEKGRSLDVIAGALAVPASSTGLLLDRLAGITMSDDAGLSHAMTQVEANGRDANIVAVLGYLDDVTVQVLTRYHRSQGSALALLLDTSTWSGQTESTRRLHEEASQRAVVGLTGAGWRVQRVTRDMSVADAWSALMNQMTTGSAAVGALV